MVHVLAVEHNGSMHTSPDSERPENQGTEDHQTTDSSGHSSNGGSQNFFAWLRGLDIQRQTDQRWITGVAGGIAKRMGIDPLVVRGGFVVLGLVGGVGVLMYLLAWLFLPNQADSIHFEDLVRGREARPEVIIVCVILAVWFILQVFGGISFGNLGFKVWDVFGIPDWLHATFSVVFWVAIGLVVVYFVYQANVSHRQHQESGAACVTHRSKSGRAQALITVALALILAGITALWVEVAGVDTVSTSSGTNAALIAALVAGTAVVAISMIIAGIRGSSLSGIGFVGFLGVAALMVTAVLPAGTTYHTIGNHSVTESTPAAISFVGNTDIDLTAYDTDLDQEELSVTQAFGEVLLQTSDARPTEITMDVAAGSINAPDLDWRDQSGLLNRRSILINEDADGPTLHVHVRLAAGSITVT